MRLIALLLAAAGLALALGAWLLLAGVVPPVAGGANMGTRIGTACLALLPAAGLLLAMIGLQSALRWVQGAWDPTLGRDGRLLLVNQRAITNTVEQLAVFAPALLALAAGAEAGAMPGVLALALVFALARGLFWLSYLASPLLRGPGMAATFGINLAALAWAASVWLG